MREVQFMKNGIGIIKELKSWLTLQFLVYFYEFLRM